MQYLKDEIRSNIIAAALMEFKEKGYKDSSVRTIAAHAGVAIGNVYRYFKNKDELFNTIIEPVYTKFTSMVFDSYQTQNNQVAIHLITEDIVTIIMDFYSRYQTELMIMIDKSQGSKYEDIKDELIRLINYRIKMELIPILKEKGASVDLDDFSYVISASFVEGIFIVLRKYSETDKIKELFEQLLVVYFDDFYRRFQYLIK